MKTPGFSLVVTIGCWVFTIFLGCGTDDGPDNPPVEKCPLVITSPSPGDTLATYSDGDIYWDQDGTVASVKIDLLHDGSVVGLISPSHSGEGYFLWNVRSYSGPDGGEYFIRVTEIGDSGCTDEVGPIVIRWQLSEQQAAFMNEHYKPDLLVEAFRPGSLDPKRSGEGFIYLPQVGPVYDVSELSRLPLWISPDEDTLRFALNIAIWNHFVFGWDDYLRASDPNNWPTGTEPTLTWEDLGQPWVSGRRQEFRELIEDFLPEK